MVALRARQNQNLQPAPSPIAHKPLRKLGLPVASVPAVAASNAPWNPATAGADYAHGTDTDRIVDLPQEQLDGDALRAVWQQRLCLPGSIYGLLPLQAASFEAMHRHGGLCGPIGVGHGKTFVVLLASVVLQRENCIILTTGPNTSGLREAYYHQIKPNFRTNVKDPIILSFDDLSTPRSRHKPDLLEELTQHMDPKTLCIAVDEAHHLKDPKSARTFRFLSFLMERAEIPVVLVSGTLIGKDLTKAAHLFGISLHNNSPLPLDDIHLRSWAEVINENGKPSPSDWNRIEPLWTWGGNRQRITAASGQARHLAIRQAFNQRYRCAPGVVASTEGSLQTALNLHAVDLPVPLDIAAALTALDDADEGPDGEPIVDDVARWRLGRNISAGFYYVFDWPCGVEDTEYMQVKRWWAKSVRREMEFHRVKGYDSEGRMAAKLAEDIAQGVRLTALHHCYQAWVEAQKRWGTAGPPTKAVWIDNYLINNAVFWAKSQKTPVILWYESKAIEDALRECGLHVYGQGTKAPELGQKAHTCAMSIGVHGTGKNLQNYSRQLLIEIPSNAEEMEQLLGRLHRPYQVADEVDAFVYQHTDPYCDAVHKLRSQARAIQDTAGNQQKLNYANYVGF